MTMIHFDKLKNKVIKKNVLITCSALMASLILSGCAPLVVGAAAGTAAGANSGSSGLSMDTQVSDSKIKFRAIDLLSKYPELKNNSNVEIVVFNKIVLILGQVPNKKVRNELARSIASLPGVGKVFNQLIISAPVSIGEYSNDGWITTKVASNLVANKINSLKFKIVTEQGVVYLMGVVSKAEGNTAAQIASRVSGVRKVVEIFSINNNINSTQKDKADVEIVNKSQTKEISSKNLK